MRDARMFRGGWFRQANDAAQRHASASLRALDDVIGRASARVEALDASTLEWQLQLARIPSPTGLEAERASAVAAALRAAQCGTVRIDASGNVVARKVPAGASDALAPVVCMAHLDTVFPLATSLEPSREGSRVICPGIGDNGRGLAALLTIANVIGASGSLSSRSELRRPIELVATVGEEGLGNLRGAHAYFADRAERGEVQPHAVVVVDGPGDARIVHQALGSRRYRVEFRGAGGHSWADFGTPNAVHAAGRATSWLSELPRNLNGKIALTVSGIGGGETVNSIPARAWIEIDLRATATTLLGRAQHEIQRMVQEAVDVESRGSAVGTALAFDMTTIGERPCGALPVEHPLVALAQAATIAQGNEPVSAVASTDANVPLSLGIPAITIGAGGSGGAAHTLHEWYDNTNGPRGISRALAIVIALAA